MNPELYAQLHHTLTHGQPPTDVKPAVRNQLLRLAPQYAIDNQILFYTPPNTPRRLRVVVRGEMANVLQQTHDHAGHFAEDNTLERTRRSFYWPAMERDIRAYVRSCTACQHYRLARRIEPLHPIPVHEPFHTISLDSIGPLPESNGARYIIIAVDHLTKWVESTALYQLSAHTTATFLFEQIVCRHGCPTRIITDNGPEFTGKVVSLLAHKLDVEHHRIIAYRPQSNGHVERANRTIINILRRAMYLPGSDDFRTDWREFLPTATFCYNTMKHSMTKYTPFYLLYGHEPRLPQDLPRSLPTNDTNNYDHVEAIRQRAEALHVLRKTTQEVREALTQQQIRYAAKYNQRLPATIERDVLRSGDLVLVQRQLASTNERKLRFKWLGPYRITRIGDKGDIYLSQLCGIPVTRPVHRNQITRFYDRSTCMNA
jgi:transposase InsO family protein